MRLLSVFAVLGLLLTQPATAADMSGMSSYLAIEKQIAFNQGRFGALYSRCGLQDEQAFIGGSLANWRTETFVGYQGSPAERIEVQKAFDTATIAVAADPKSCLGWRQQAAKSWSAVVHMARTGTPVTSN